MNLWQMLGTALGLAMDAFAVSIAAGIAISPLTGRHVFRLSFHFGLFQFLMPVIGWLAGRTVAGYIGAWDHWAAFGLLTVIGAKMLWESREISHERPKSDPTRGMTLVMFSIATSIDALAVGLTLALLKVNVLLAAVIIGLVAAAMTFLGIRFGSRLGRAWGRWAELAGGAILILLGLRVLWEHVG